MAIASPLCTLPNGSAPQIRAVSLAVEQHLPSGLGSASGWAGRGAAQVAVPHYGAQWAVPSLRGTSPRSSGPSGESLRTVWMVTLYCIRMNSDGAYRHGPAGQNSAKGRETKSPFAPESESPSISAKGSPIVSSGLVASCLETSRGQVPPRGPHGVQTYQCPCLPRPLELEVGAPQGGGKRGRPTGCARRNSGRLARMLH